MGLTDEEAAELASAYGICDPADLKETFKNWLWAYQYGQRRDDSLSPTGVRNELQKIAKSAAKLEGELANASGKTVRSLASVSPSFLEHPDLSDDLERLNQAGLIGSVAPTPMIDADIRTMFAAIRFIARHADASATGIDTVMQNDGRKTPPRGYASKPALYTLVGNIKTYWEANVGPYTRNFDDYDDDSGKPAQIPQNAASRFTVECVQRINPDIQTPTIAKAMQERIKPPKASELR